MSEPDAGDRTERSGDRDDDENRVDEADRPGDADREDPPGFEDAVESSPGNPLVLFGLNAALSAAFAWIAVWALGMLGFVEYTAVNVATAAIVLFALTYVLVLQ